MKEFRLVPSLLLAFGLFSSVYAEEVATAADTKATFVEKPKVVKEGDGVKIAFTVSKATDVEISILDKNGVIVRHLVAGVLDKTKTPPEPLKKGLAQEILWDGKTDTGKKAEGGPFKVRLRLGLTVKLDKFIGEQKHHIANGYGLATDDEGHLYVYSASTGNKSAGGTRYLLKYTREGKYIKTLMPLPADLDPVRANKLGMVKVPGDERLYPKSLAGTWPVLGFQPGAIYHRADSKKLLTFFDWRNIHRLADDGGPASDKWAIRVWEKPPRHGLWRWELRNDPKIVIDPAGKVAYMTGLTYHKGKGKGKKDFPANRIFRISLSEGRKETFADVKGVKEVGAMAFDPEGNLLICTPEKVVVLDPEGKEIGSMKVNNPNKILCHRKTGAIYTLNTGPKKGNWIKAKTLVKYNNWKEGKELSRFKLSKRGANACMAIDDKAPKPIIWVLVDRAGGCYPFNLATPATLLRLEDDNNTFVKTKSNIDYLYNPFGTVTRLAVHPAKDQVLCKGEFTLAGAFDGSTGKAIKLPFKKCLDFAVGLDGNWYVVPGDSFMGAIRKYDSDFKPIPVPGRKDNKVGFEFGRWGAGFGVGGIAADANGRVFALQQCNQKTVAGDMLVTFDPTGKADKYERMKDDPRMTKHHKHFNSGLFAPIETRVGDVAVDWKGFAYLALYTLPLKHTPPPGYSKDPGYWHCTGSIVKIGPEGGSLFYLGGKGTRPGRKVRTIPAGMKGMKTEIKNRHGCGPQFCEGALKIYPGIGVMGGQYGGGCRCRQPMFELDGWGRLFIPNATTFNVRVVDNEGNEILKFGHYGNADSRGQGKDSPITTPAIPLGWPEAVGVSHKAVYVADVLNRRVVRLVKVYDAEEEIEF
jgi:hypothetical protein